MFKNPLKYQIGGVAQQNATSEVKAFISNITGASEEQIDSVLEQIKGDENAIKELSTLLQLANDKDEKAIQTLKQLFAPQQSSYMLKKGGKIQDFICKHGHGGKAGCGCVKAQDGTKFYNENGVELPNGPIYREGRYGYMVAPTKSGETAMFLNNLNSKTAYWNIPPYPVEQSINKFSIRSNADYPAIFTIDPMTAEESSRAKANIIKYQPQDKPWNGVERKQEGGDIVDFYKNKLSNDAFRIKSSWNKFKNSAPGQVIQFLTPDITSENGAIGAVVPGVKVGKTVKIVKKAKPETYSSDFWRNYRTSKPVKMRDDFAEEYNWVTGHSGPLWDVLIEENGGNITYAQNGTDLDSTIMSRRDALTSAQKAYGLNRNQARIAYANALHGLRNQGLKGNELRKNAREMIAGLNNLPEIDDTASPVAISSQDLDVNYYVDNNGNNVPIFEEIKDPAYRNLVSGLNLQQAKEAPVYNFTGVSDEDLANRTINGEFGNGAERRNALGNRYDSVQRLINNRLRKTETPTPTSGFENIVSVSNKTIDKLPWYKRILTKLGTGLTNTSDVPV